MGKTTGAVLGDIYDAWRAQDLAWLASCLPDDFTHVVNIPPELHPAGGEAAGKEAVLARLGSIAAEFDFIRFDTSDLMFDSVRAGIEIPVLYRHRKTGAELETTIVNFWTMENGSPVRLVEYHEIARIQAFASTMASLTQPQDT